MDITAAWDAVLAIQTDIAAIVSQAVRAGRLSPNDAEDAVNTAMVSSLALAKRYDGTIGTFAAYALATIRRSLLWKQDRATDAMAHVAAGTEIPESADISANCNEAGFSAAGVVAAPIPQVACLSALENRVARLLAAGRPIGQIAKQCGMTTHGVKIVAGQVRGRIKGEGKKAI